MQHISAIATSMGVTTKTVRRRLNAANIPIVRGFATVPEDLPAAPAEAAPKKVVQATPKAASPPAQKARINTDIFRSHSIAIIGAVVLIATDALSFGWIAYNTYADFRHAAAGVFALAGFAVGYSAIKNVVSYTGWNGDAWAWGFALFQMCLHLAAMEVFGSYSFLIGKIIISAGLPLAVAGLAISLRPQPAGK